MTSCKCCGKQYVGSATGFKERFRTRKNDINSVKLKCGVANHLLNVCRSCASKFQYLQVQLKEEVFVQMLTVLKKFYGKEKNTGWRNYLH